MSHGDKMKTVLVGQMHGKLQVVRTTWKGCDEHLITQVESAYEIGDVHTYFKKLKDNPDHRLMRWNNETLTMVRIELLVVDLGRDDSGKFKTLEVEILDTLVF